MSRAEQILKISELGFGQKGMDFEKAFVTGCQRIGLMLYATPHAEKFWDFHALRGPWNPFLLGNPVNLKNHKTPFLFSDSTIRDMLPWKSGTLPQNYNIRFMENEVYKYLYLSRFPVTTFLKPENRRVEDAVMARGYGEPPSRIGAPPFESLANILSKSHYWLAAQLGRNFTVRIRINEDEKRVSTVSIVNAAGKVFGTSERKGNTLFFRHPRTRLQTLGYRNIPIMVSRGSSLFG